MGKINVLGNFEFVPDEQIEQNFEEDCPPINVASNCPATGGPIYSKTFWDSETIQELLDDISCNALGG
jgi:hypothetical protein